MPDIEAEAPAIFRGMLRDVVACSDYAEVCRLLGLVPAGPDVDEIEHYQSHARIADFIPVAADALSHADVAANLLYRLTRMGEHEEDGDERSQTMFHFVTRTACTAVISHLLQKGILEIGDKA
ncbi:hypothetical protein [Actinacidiphila sp. ITFR-21]|uniref:hypothetical protein n=1 Tax=Actinacidiphila sp. ITFR-21 TaxID=3075199 RepID=UPI00288A16E3|nr:hypothetical protein [Streptomyces sp. ITFR-21]WNI17592.1 hypothetical protein RLT57_20095 [Streptomyces sp. ITFR-21]WNI17732.1 hypothetical protein RLT57_20810 [Streptomyces sp. ITFR-21]